MTDGPGAVLSTQLKLWCGICSTRPSSTGPWSMQNSGPCVNVLHRRFAAKATVRLASPSGTTQCHLGGGDLSREEEKQV